LFLFYLESGFVRIGRRLSDFLSKKTKRGQVQRGALAKRILSGRARDVNSMNAAVRDELGWNVSRSLFTTGQFKPFFVKRVLGLRKKKVVPLKMLDIGAGLGFVGNDLRAIAGKGSVVEGLKLTLSSANERKIVQQTMDKELVGSIENYRFKNKYDFIFSISGGTAYTANLSIAVEKICNSLTLGGEAVLHVLPGKIAPLIEPLRKNGFQVFFCKGFA